MKKTVCRKVGSGFQDIIFTFVNSFPQARLLNIVDRALWLFRLLSFGIQFIRPWNSRQLKVIDVQFLQQLSILLLQVELSLGS